MTHSVSSASSLDSHAPSEYSGQSQGVRWEEQQKVLALEQLCGVFRVDLGHMRSLRLFFRSAGSHEGGGGHLVMVLCCRLEVRCWFGLCQFVENKFSKEKKKGLIIQV